MSLDVYLKPKACGCCGKAPEGYWANITHNLNEMAQEAGIYGVVWRPEENGITQAMQLIQPLTDAIAWMRREPERFKKRDAENGWGTYDDFLPWLESYLAACKRIPDAEVEASR